MLRTVPIMAKGHSLEKKIAVWHPVAYASRSLSEITLRMFKIEKEALAAM